MKDKCVHLQKYKEPHEVKLGGDNSIPVFDGDKNVCSSGICYAGKAMVFVTRRCYEDFCSSSDHSDCSIFNTPR